jgi:hypothetical protein
MKFAAIVKSQTFAWGLVMNISTLIPIAILFVAFVLVKLLPRLIVRQVARVAFSAVGKQAMSKVPEQIQLARVASPQWKDEATMQQQAAPLVHAGFSDLGAFSVDKMPGVLMRMLFQPQTYVAAQICEHPKAGGWTEFATRYADGSSDFLTTMPDQGIGPPPFVRTNRAAKGTPTDSLYQQHLKQRKASGIKPVSQNEVVREFEVAYMRYMIWKNNKGLTPEEVGQVALKWANAKKQAAGQS